MRVVSAEEQQQCVAVAKSTRVQCRKTGELIAELNVYKCELHHPYPACSAIAKSTGRQCKKKGYPIEGLHHVYKCEYHHPWPACSGFTQLRKRCKRKGVINAPPDANGDVQYYCTNQHLIRNRGERVTPATSDVPPVPSVPADPTPGEDGLLDALRTQVAFNGDAINTLALLMRDLTLARNS